MFTVLCRQFPTDSDSKKILNIGEYLAKIEQKVYCSGTFFCLQFAFSSLHIVKFMYLKNYYI